MSHGGDDEGVVQKVGKISDFFDSFGLKGGYAIALLGLIAFGLVVYFVGFSITQVLWIIFIFSPIYVPYIIFHEFFTWWKIYIQRHFDLAQGRVSLEIRIPQEIFKSPRAMEMVLEQLYQTSSPDNLVQTYWDGKHPPTMALEIVSTGGQVRFFVNVPRRKIKNLIEVHLYAQYPGIEIKEHAFDYTADVPWDPDKNEVFSLHFMKRNKSGDFFPIKTFYDFGLDKDPKEEYKTDPLTSILEVLGSIKQGEHIWYQFLISAHREENFEVGSLGTHPDWSGSIKEAIENIISSKRVDPVTGKESKERKTMQLTEAEKQGVKNLENALSKYAFNTKVRVIYAAKKEAYVPGERIGQIISSFFAFNNRDTRLGNSFKLAWRSDFNWNWWQDPSGHKRKHLKEEELMDYKKRRWEEHTHTDVGSVFTTEELATLFHLPGKVAFTPTLERIPSVRGQAPSNLPT